MNEFIDMSIEKKINYLYFAEKFSFDEIAKHTGLSKEQVYKIISKRLDEARSNIMGK